MKKSFIKLLLPLLITSSSYADMTRLELGGGVWSQNSSGSMDDRTFYGTNKVTDSSKTSAYAWMFFRHPLPIIPNIRLEYSKLENSGIASGVFKNFIAPTPSASSFEASQYDIIAYYNLLDETFWLSVDLGLGAKFLDTTFKADNVIVNTLNQNYSKKQNIPIPLVYVRGRSEIPSTNFAIEADIKGISYSSSTMYDARAKVDYTFELTPVVKPAIEVGYRIEKVKVDTGSIDYKTDIKFSGFYAGAVLKF